MRRRIFQNLILATVLAGCQAAAWADTTTNYPSKPITIVVSFPPGGIIDIQARLVGQKLSEKWNVPVLIQNVTGAGGNIGTAAAFKGDTQGYTLLATTPGPMSINQYLFKTLGYEPEKFVPISLMTTFSNTIVAKLNGLREPWRSLRR